jgi:prepilin peptidase CpaA
VIGLAMWLPLYAGRLIGAGDVKLFASGAAWLGWQSAILAALVAAVVGGVLGLGWLLWRQGAFRAAIAMVHALRSPRLLQLQPLDRRERVPYALAIGAGLFAAWIHLVLADAAGGVR